MIIDMRINSKGYTKDARYATDPSNQIKAIYI